MSEEDLESDDIPVDATTITSIAAEATSAQHLDNTIHFDEEGRPLFPPSKDTVKLHGAETRKVPIPPHRIKPLKSAWPKIYPPLVEHLKLQVRMNLKGKGVELRSSKYTSDDGALQRGEDFTKAFCLGFDADDAIALLRLDDLYIEVGHKLHREMVYF